ncbi:ABC transporter ATP-binding protein [Streptomyces sp. NPDC049954]|uniref:ABC transporter ATP-binding protein n=1 Tax=Streptomyces sp. NPDC049954 TaxID=3155779 RepID=UPI003449CB56
MSQELLPISSRRQTLAFLGRMAASNRRATVAAAGTTLLASVAGLVPPWAIGKIVNDIGSGHDTIFSQALLICLATAAAAVFGGLSVTALASAGEPALAELREEVLDRALHLPADRIERATTGDLLSRLSDDVRTVSQGLSDVVPVIVSSAVTVALTAAGALALDWRLGLAIVAVAPLFAGGLRWYLPRSEPLYREERIAQGERAEALLSGIGAAPTARAFAIGGPLLQRIEDTSERVAALSVSVYRTALHFLMRNNVSELVGLALVLGLGFVLVRDDLTTVGAVTTAALYFLRLFTPIGGILFTFDRFQSIGAALSRLVGIALMPKPPAPDRLLEAGRGEIVLDGITHEYTPGTPVLRDVTLRIAPGERIALVGATGAGKTTLGAIAAGVLRPSRGEVSYGGKPYDPVRTGVRANVFLITQDAHAFAGTVRNSLTLVRPGASDQEIRRALDITKADRWVDALPDGLDTVVGEEGNQLTAEQVQQLTLARVVLGDPWFVVLDEATAEAGSAGARVLEAAATAAVQGRTALIVAHRLTQARLADRVLVMHGGVIAEQGTHEELLALQGRYWQLWQAWSNHHAAI